MKHSNLTRNRSYYRVAIVLLVLLVGPLLLYERLQHRQLEAR